MFPGAVDLDEAENHPLALDSDTDDTEGLFPSSGEHPRELIHIRIKAGLKCSFTCLQHANPHFFQACHPLGMGISQRTPGTLEKAPEQHQIYDSRSPSAYATAKPTATEVVPRMISFCKLLRI